MTQILAKIVVALAFVFIAEAVQAAGFQYLTIPDDTGRPIELGIWYPSDSSPAPIDLAHFAQTVALDGEIKGDRLPIVIFSHGSAGRFNDRAASAAMLADAGFVAVSLTHPGDNYKEVDPHGLQIMIDRPRQIERVLDYVTRSWPGRVHLDATNIGLYGFSAGGFTGLVVIGGTPDWTLFAPHCATDPTEPVCSQGIAKALSRPATAAMPASTWQHDPRIKAAVLASPGFAFSFDPASLRDITIPVELWGGSADQFVPFDSNAGYLQRYIPHVVAAHDVPNAGHFSFLQPCSDAGRAAHVAVCEDQPGFDRAAFQEALNRDLVRFFKAELRGN